LIAVLAACSAGSPGSPGDAPMATRARRMDRRATAASPIRTLHRRAAGRREPVPRRSARRRVRLGGLGAGRGRYSRYRDRPAGNIVLAAHQTDEVTLGDLRVPRPASEAVVVLLGLDSDRSMHRLAPRRDGMSAVRLVTSSWCEQAQATNAASPRYSDRNHVPSCRVQSRHDP
jgi:hypothetical protein